MNIHNEIEGFEALVNLYGKMPSFHESTFRIIDQDIDNLVLRVELNVVPTVTFDLTIIEIITQDSCDITLEDLATDWLSDIEFNINGEHFEIKLIRQWIEERPPIDFNLCLLDDPNFDIGIVPTEKKEYLYQIIITCKKVIITF